MPKLKSRMYTAFAFIFFMTICSFFGCTGNTNENNNPNDNYENTENFILHAYDYKYVFVYNSLEDNVSCHKMNYEADNWYKITLSAGDLQFCFAKSDVGENQTQPFTIEVSSGDEKWYKNGNLYNYKPTNDDSYDEETGDSDNENTGNNGNESADSWTSNIYLEIMPFSYRTMSFNDGKPIRLTSDTAKEFKEKLNTEYKLDTIPGTAVYYSIHKALVNLRNYNFPADLKSINIITFTDGLDNASADLSTDTPLEDENNKSDEEYGKWIKNKIDSETFSDNKLKLECNSVAVKGKDITSNQEISFKQTLSYITSKGKEIIVKDNFSEISETFSSIAEGLAVKKNIYDYTLLVPGGYSFVKMVFDGKENSELYFEGTINTDTHILTITNSKGFVSTPENEIHGEKKRDDEGVFTGSYFYKMKLEFPNNAPDGKTLFSKDMCKQYYKNSSSTSSYFTNVEYDATGEGEPIIENFSTVIYLLLDCTGSLENKIEEVRKAAINFVDKLAEKAKATN